MSTIPRTYTAEQVAKIFQIPTKAVYVMGAAGGLPGRITIGNRTRFWADIIDGMSRGDEAA